MVEDIRPSDTSPAEIPAWECLHLPRCADATCSYNPAMLRWLNGCDK